ncbi:MAG: GGDEF domain-containing protein [Burkholderiales bacterium]|nr:GGDEF domain-containing protein [Burkholderiales bacterium]
MSAAALSAANPTEIARETFRQLATQRIAPTPENYARIYAQVSGEPSVHPAAALVERALAAVIKAAGAPQAPAQAALAAFQRQKWEEVDGWLQKALLAQSGEPQPWHDLVRDLLRQWELRHDGLPQGRKRESLDHVLDNSRADPRKLFVRLSALVRSWSEAPIARADANPLPSIARGAGEAERADALRELLAQTLEFAVTDRLGYTPELAADAARLALLTRQAADPRDLNKLGQALKAFWLKLELRGESVDGLMRGLVTLIKLLTTNVGALSGDPWLTSQMARAEALLKEPLDARALREAERGFREVAFRQASLKNDLDEAKTALKTMVTLFIDRLDELTESTGDYHDKFSQYAGQIEAADSIAALSGLIQSLLADTRGAQVAMRRSRDELRQARETARTQEERVRQLETELAEVGSLVKEDQLTSVLNRRGLEEAFEVEASRVRRAGTPLVVALLDVDNFKRLNDQLGHLAGDSALKHLAGILRDAIRPSDVVGRYGGEEFVLYLPDTGLEEAAEVMRRVQRTLTRRFFLHQNEKVLITFSAGVALLGDGETRDAVIARADAAMYKAKQTGKNRVCVAD